MIKEIDVLDGMATAVEDASIVCILFSKAYQNGGNTEVEAKHALSRGKKRIFLRVERKFVPTHWLGAMLGTSRYIDFSGKYPYEDKIEELYQTIVSFVSFKHIFILNFSFDNVLYFKV
ncbi:unnamed protein product [Trichobilharzia regenti]|nr:unnamed protein product [Trichobilharzia regenti]